MEPEKATAPIIAPSTPSHSASEPCCSISAGLSLMRISSTAAIAAAAPPPMPL